MPTDNESYTHLKTIEDARTHRAFLLQTMLAVGEQRVNVQQANAIAALSGEVHKSIRLEFDMACYAVKNLRIEGGQVRMLLESDDVE